MVLIYLWPVLIIQLVSCGEQEQSVTFSKHIAPILFKNCSPCHRPGSAGTFDLLTFEQVRQKALTIEAVIKSGLMPPWPADPTYQRYRDEKVLTEEEIGLFSQWLASGCPPGNLSEATPIPDFPDHSFFGKPDTAITMKNSFFISGDNRDQFIMMKIPFELNSDTFIRGIEIIPGNRKLVHHINAHLLQYEEGKKKNIFSGLPFINTEEMDKQSAYKLLSLPNDDGSYPMLTPNITNYLPGVESSFYPEGIGGYRVRKQNVLLLDNIHYGPSPVDTSDSTTFNIFFSSIPPKRPAFEFILGTSGISPVIPPLVIEPGVVKKFYTSFVVPQNLSVLTVNPHMHLLGKSFLAYAVKPNGDTIPLVRIKKWDFRWQYFYTFTNMIPMPEGTTIYAEGEFDNTTNNPLNPFNPPQKISDREGSMRTTDEMFQLIVTYTLYHPGDEKVSLELNSK